MLTMRTSIQIAGNRHRLSFPLCPASTGRPRGRASATRLLDEWRRMLNAESRRLWLAMQWRSHLGRVRRMQA
jgi:hypothetical protein